MPYVTSWERMAREEGKAEGKAEGRAEGLREGLLEAIDLGLELRFGKEALPVLLRVRAMADLERLRALKASLARVASLAEFESLLGAS